MSNLLERASIVTTATGYSDSKLASVKPNRGENLVLYSEDYSQSRWRKDNVTLSNASTSPFLGTATKLTSTTSSTWARIFIVSEIDYSKYVVSSVYLRSDTPFTASLRSRVSGGETVVKNINVTSTWQRFSILTNTSGRDNDIHIFLNNDGINGTSVNGRTLEVIAVQMERGNTPSSYIKTNGSIAKNGDFDFSRGSSATRVNSQGLIEDVQIIGSELVQNGDFSSGSSNWSLASNWNISSNWIYSDGTNGVAEQSLPITLGNEYRVKFDIIQQSTTGHLRMRLGSHPNMFVLLLASNYTVGTHTIDTIAAGSAKIYLEAQNGYNGAIGNISVKEITDDTNLPRIDYTDGAGSILLEPQSSNLLPYSSDFSNAAWSKQGASVGSQVLSLSGNNDAYEIIESNTGNMSRFVDAATVVAGEVYTISIFAKKNTRSFFNITMHSSVFGNNAYANYNLNNGTVNYTANGATSKIEDYGNGWYRCSITVTANIDAGHGSAEITLSDQASSARIPSYQGDGVSSMYFWGCQYELSDFATSYIPTNGSTVTRLGETLTNSGNADLFGTEGVLYFEGKHKQINSNKWLGIDNGSMQYAVKFLITNASNLLIWIKVNNVLVYQGGLNTTLYNYNIFSDYFKAAVSYSSQGVKVYLNGLQVDTNSTAINMPSNALNTLNFARNGSTEPVFGNYKCVAVFKEALTDAELQSLTTI